MKRRASQQSRHHRGVAPRCQAKFRREAAEAIITLLVTEHCTDSSMVVRKQMVISLTELVKNYLDNFSLVKVC